MKCTEVINLMSAAIDGQASAEERAALDEHLAGCASCTELFAAEEEMDSDLRRLFVPRREAAAGLAGRVARAVAESETASPSRPEPSRAPLPLTAALAPAGQGEAGSIDAGNINARNSDSARLQRSTITRPAFQQIASWLAAMAAGFLIAVLVFQPWKRSGSPTDTLQTHRENKTEEPAKTAVENPAKVGAVEPPVARLVVATGDVTIRPTADADWSAVPPSSAAADFACPAGGSVRTEPGVRCEMQTTAGCVIRMNDDSQVTVRSPRSLELHKGQVWCSAPEEVTMEVSTSVPPESGPCGRGAPAGRSWTFKGPPNASLISSVNEKGNLRLTAARGEVDLRSGESQRVLPPGQTVTISGGRIESAPYGEDALLAATWIDALLVRKGHANPELLARVDGLLAQIGRAKASFLYEQELRGLGEHCVLPLLRYVQSPPSDSDRSQRHMAMRIIADLAPSWAVGDLISLLSDDDEEVRYEAAVALRRLTGQSQGRDPDGWRKPWTVCTPTFASWQTWWQSNRQRYPTPEFTKAIAIPKQGVTKKG